MSDFADAARLFVAPAMASYHGTPKGAVFRGLNNDGGDLVADPVIGRLRSQQVEEGAKIVTRERVTIQIEQGVLPADRLPLLDTQLVTVTTYPGADFNVVPDETDYGGAMLKFTLSRKPLDRMGDKRRRGR